MNQQNQTNNSLQTILTIIAIGLLAYVIYQMTGDSASSYRAVVEPAPDTALIADPLPVAEPLPELVEGEAQPGLVIIEEPAVIIATGAPPVAAPTATATSAPTAVPTHPPLPSNMQEAHEMGYWPMPITPAQFEQCQDNPQVNPACQFYVGGGR